ncbi:PEGA domain-containing protein [Methanogenium cariaci]|jgi:PEGA domain-containing protein
MKHNGRIAATGWHGQVSFMRQASAMRFISGILFLLLIQAVVSPASADIQKGTISVTSNPQGADIYLNDEDLGLQTNTVIQDVFPGIHYIRLELPGYRTWETIFEVKEGQTAYISHNLEPVVGDAFSVSTTPEGARIFIDGQFSGTSNVVLYELPAGQHRVLLQLENYSDYAVTVTINEDMSQSLVHTFEPVSTVGRITVESVPSNAEIYLNGEFKGNTRTTLEDVVPGTYDVVIRKIGYDDWTGRVDVAAGKISEVKAELLPAQVLLSVHTAPGGAQVFVDGVLSGSSPLEIPVGQGLHTIVVEKFGYRSVEEELDVGAAGATVSLNLVSMAPEAIAEAERVVSENLGYNPKKAQTFLENAKRRYAAGDAPGAIADAASAIAAAVDVDGDGVLNPQDISPNLHNVVIYASPFVLVLLVLVVFVKDVVGHRVKSEIVVHLPVTVRENDTLAQAEVTADISGGPYRGFVCTVSIDGVSIDHFTDPGTYVVSLAGRSRGVHHFSVDLQVAKERYGRAGKKVEKIFIVEPVEQVHSVLDHREGDDDNATDVPKDERSGVETLYEGGPDAGGMIQKSRLGEDRCRYMSSSSSFGRSSVTPNHLF